MRLRRLREELGPDLVIEWRAFPLRPEPDEAARWAGTFREAAWKRCHAMAAGDGVTFTPWARPDYPNWSLPALEAAKCVTRQGAEAFERLHLRLYEAFFTHGRNIADPTEVAEIVRESGADMDRYAADQARGDSRNEVWCDFQRAVAEHGVRAIPTLVVGTHRLVGLVEFADYRTAAADTG